MGGCDSSCNRRRPRRKARSSAAGDRAATGRARRAEERRQGAHGNAASGGAYHRGDEGGRGGLATPCSAAVLVLEPGDVGLGNRKATAMGRRRAAAPPPGDRPLRIARSAQARGRCARIAGVSAVITRADVAISVVGRPLFFAPPHACCGVVSNGCCDGWAPRGTVLNPSSAPLPPPKPAIACTS